MALRELYATDVTANPKGCRVIRWLNNFDDADDAAFLMELLGSRIATDEFMRWCAKNDLPSLSKDYVNDHRRRRCTCPDEFEGRIQ